MKGKFTEKKEEGKSRIRIREKKTKRNTKRTTFKSPPSSLLPSRIVTFEQNYHLQ